MNREQRTMSIPYQSDFVDGPGVELPGVVDHGQQPARELSLRQARMLAELKIEIGVELGEIVTSADKLIDLVPGNTLEFSLDPEQALTLRLYGEYLGTGRLVRDAHGVSLEILSVAISGEEAAGSAPRSE